MFDALLRMQLGPIVERLAEMEAQLEDLYRRAESFCRIGVCQQVDAASTTCRVSHGELLTPAIRFFNPSAGAQTETRIPSVGEHCLLLNYGGGEGGAQSVALFGLNSSLFPPVSTVPSMTRRRHQDGTQSDYDDASHTFNWANGPTMFTGSREQVDLKVGAASLTLNPQGITLQIGGTALLLDAGGAHFSGPVIDHQGRVISP
ncbi:phage baseplate assembly protein V [Pseudomonas fluorescens]|jgi:phage baseplate assembly protein V|uniref:Baseplate assembly protein n=1 Tax=Pseudomonas fluorescens TaxID=294 RepID=A0A2N1EAC8_PSEFL|nr:MULTISPECIES: phage baseplate assembly protein V [Pseudomonas]MBD8095866.1 phage baseplate assembly protein V [Pseudomonas fluorescens]MBD8772640.1 phage baseplate assembly protein V [Pseudomonas fluorescens]MBD8778325.1 phage baseplate assembly protein V [Pseudomonas fluorescens]MBD8795215.1 phage baseplate assembly protein V [Pseudomonas fluorescens]PKH23389.1 baseplate assembly protein [Pseudomonas fluorescens]